MLAPSLDLESAKVFILGWPYPPGTARPPKSPGKSNLCAIITAIHEYSGLGQERKNNGERVRFVVTIQLRGWRRSVADLPVLLEPLVKLLSFNFP